MLDKEAVLIRCPVADELCVVALSGVVDDDFTLDGGGGCRGHCVVRVIQKMAIYARKK